MKKSKFLWFVLLILAVGCGQTGTETTAEDWHSGTKALEMNFMEGAPPRVVFHGDKPDVILELWNKGITAITNGNIYISGFDTNIIKGMPAEAVDFSISEKTQYNLEGGYDTIDLDDEESGEIEIAYDFPTGSLPTKIKATAIYLYATDFSTDFCVDKKPHTTEDKICTMEDKSFSGGQGAPVAVTKIEPQAVGENIRFKVTFRNSGDGDVLKKDSVGTSPSNLGANNYDYVTVDEAKAKLGGSSATECQPNGVKLVNGQGFTFCTFSGIGDDAYTTRLDLNLEYGYMNSEEFSVQVKALPGTAEE